MEEENEIQEGYKIPREMYIIAYFALLAMFVLPATRMHMGTAAIFFSMIGAGIALALIYLIGKFARHKMATLKLSKKGLTQLMVGYRPSELVVESVPGQRNTDALHSLELVPLVYPDGDIEEDSVIEPNPLYIADRFQPNVSTLLGAMMLLIGLRRSGKSNLLAVLVEELGRFAVPMIIFDTEDEYSGLVDKKYMPRGYHVGSAELQQESPHLDRYVAIDADGAYEFGKAVLDGGLQVVINLKSWAADEDAALIMTEIIDGLNDWEQGRKSEERIPCMVFLDEAQKWLPQNTGDKYVSKETQTLLHHAFFDILVARGGKRGFGLVVAAQRYSQLNKNVLQSLWKFLFLQTEEIDLKRYEALGIPRDQTSTLRQGECFIFSPMVIGLKTMIRLRYSPHQGHTPGLDNLLSHNRRLAPVDVILSRSFASAGNVATVSKETRRLDVETPLVLPTTKLPEVELETNPPVGEEEEKSGQFLSKRQTLALAYYQQGKTGVVELASALTQDGQCGNVSNDAAYKLLVELDNLGLIIRRKKGSNE